MSDWQGNAPTGHNRGGYPQQGYTSNHQPYGTQYQGGLPRGTTDPADLSLPLYGATFKQAVRRFFKSYARFTGRASRSEYWWAQVFLGLLSLIPSALLTIALVVAVASAAMEDNEDPGSSDAAAITSVLLLIGGVLGFLLFVATIIPALAVEGRRLHDAGYTGFFLLLRLVPGGSLVLPILSFMPSTHAGERFDPGMNQGW